jgi:sarcosine oxidase subunit beta
MDEVADAVVIGGGITGASTAFHLASKGLRRVVICERRTLAAGATGKSAAFIQVVETSEAEARITLASLPYYSHWDELVGAGSCAFERTGYLRVGPAHLEESARRHVELSRSWGVDADILDRDQVAELAPYIETSDVAFGLFQPNAGHASSTGTAVGFMHAASRLGADVREHTEVLGVEKAAGRVTGVRTQSGTISAPVVVIAAGAWGLPLLEDLGMSLPVIAARTQVALFKWPAGAEPIRFMNISDHVNGCYFAWHGDDARNIVVGLSADKRQPIDDLENLRETGDPDYAATAQQRLTARMPAAEYVRRNEGWAGPVTLTPDRATIIDEVPDARGLFFVVGCNGRGFKGAPAVGRALAEWAVDGAPTVVDLTPFTAQRFESEGRYARPLEYSAASGEYDALRHRATQT